MGNAISNCENTVIETTKSISWDIGESTFIKSIKDKSLNVNNETSSQQNNLDKRNIKQIHQKD
jgi:hypothetical protein